MFDWETADTLTRIIYVLLLLHPIASLITALTPTPKDDTVYGKLYNTVIRPLALNIGLAKDKPSA